MDLPFIKPEKVGMDAKKLKRVDQKMEELIKEDRLAGGIVVVARKGKVVHFGTYGKRDLENNLPVEKDTIFRIYSMTKAITSVAALMLNEEGKLSLDDPLSKYFPSLQAIKVLDKDELVEPNREATVADLLRHTSGLTYAWSSNKKISQALKDAGVLDRDKELVPMMNGMDKVPLLFQPGSDWVYGCSTDVLGGLVEVASGIPLDRFFRERIFKPLEMEDTGFYVPANKADRFAANYNFKDGKLTLKDDPKTSRYLENPAFKSGGGGLCSTAQDYIRFLLMIENGGKFYGKRYLKKKSVKLMTTNQVSEEAGWVTFGNQIREGVGYGYGFSVRVKMSDWDPDGRVGEYGWGGAASTHYWVSPKDELVVLTLEQVMPYSFNTEWALKGLIYDALLD
ncbi:beta-lactamase family protein [Opitutales bacterium]|nr:beta-lactamase family protein [Opitutales bacterium]